MLKLISNIQMMKMLITDNIPVILKFRMLMINLKSLNLNLKLNLQSILQIQMKKNLNLNLKMKMMMKNQTIPILVENKKKKKDKTMITLLIAQQQQSIVNATIKEKLPLSTDKSSTQIGNQNLGVFLFIRFYIYTMNTIQKEKNLPTLQVNLVSKISNTVSFK